MSKAYGYALGKGRAILSAVRSPAVQPPMTVVQKPVKPAMPARPVMRPAAQGLLQRRMQNASDI